MAQMDLNSGTDTILKTHGADSNVNNPIVIHSTNLSQLNRSIVEGTSHPEIFDLQGDHEENDTNANEWVNDGAEGHLLFVKSQKQFVPQMNKNKSERVRNNVQEIEKLNGSRNRVIQKGYQRDKISHTSNANAIELVNPSEVPVILNKNNRNGRFDTNNDPLQQLKKHPAKGQNSSSEPTKVGTKAKHNLPMNVWTGGFSYINSPW